MTEQFANQFITTLAAAIPDDVRPVTFTVADTTGAPSPEFRVRIETELLLVSSVNGADWTADTVEGTTAVAHAIDVDVEHVLTAATVQDLVDNTMRKDAANTVTKGTTGFDGDPPIEIEMGHLEDADRAFSVAKWYAPTGKGAPPPELQDQMYVRGDGSIEALSGIHLPAGSGTAPLLGSKGSPDSGSPVTTDLSRAGHQHALNLHYVNGSGNAFSTFNARETKGEDVGIVTTDGQMILFDVYVPAWQDAGGGAIERRTVSEITFASGDTALSGCDHLWAAVYGYESGGAKPLVIQSADEPGATWAANSKKTFSFTETEVTNTTYDNFLVVLVALMIDATQHPSLLGFPIHAALDSDDNSLPGGISTGLTDTAPASEVQVFSVAAVRLYCEVR